jgi:3-oxoacyl-(acyl-carrier-protein) synthase
MDPFIHYGMAAASRPWDSGLEVTEANAERIGVAIGSGIGGMTGIENSMTPIWKGGPRKISPFFVPQQHHQHDLRATCPSCTASRGPISPSSPPAPPAPTTSARPRASSPTAMPM